ncbi:MAG: hypothetical protein JXA20_15480 [Spirochaetes bacterium]|nr:hypothetical protein [Spirochaetota bacterium]
MPLLANSVGVYFKGGVGESRMKSYYYGPYPPYSTNYSFKGLNYELGGGFVFDTSIAGDELVNYRLNLSIDEFNYPIAPVYIWMPYNYVPKLTYGDALRLGIKNTFGFSFFRNGLFRAWAGPSLSSYYYPGRLSSNNYRRILPRLFTPGAVIGLDYHIFNSMSMIFECGLTYEWSAPKNSENHMNSLNCYISFGLVFRLNKDENSDIRLMDQCPKGIEIEKEKYKESQEIPPLLMI